jgi:hypothetical protein
MSKGTAINKVPAKLEKMDNGRWTMDNDGCGASAATRFSSAILLDIGEV